MNPFTREQLRAISLAFYDVQAEAFDASRIDLPWPGWERVVAALPSRPIRVLDIGCGNGRLASFLDDADLVFDYTGVDASRALIEAAETRLGESLRGRARFLVHDFLAATPAGADLPRGPFDLIALMGVLHHVPSREARLDLLREAAERLAPGGLLSLTTWQFGGRARFERRQVDWASLGLVLGSQIDLADLEDGDTLLRFGDDPGAPPRYCHQVADDEFESWPRALALEPVAEFRADGSQGDLNRYWILRRD